VGEESKPWGERGEKGGEKNKSRQPIPRKAGLLGTLREKRTVFGEGKRFKSNTGGERQKKGRRVKGGGGQKKHVKTEGMKRREYIA